MQNKNIPQFRYLVLWALLLTLFVSCQTEPTNQSNPTTTATTNQPNNPVAAVPIDTTALAWYFETIEDATATPNTTIYLVYKGIKYKSERGIGQFSVLPKSEYSQPQYAVPNKAIIAASGYWAGLLQIYYATTENNDIVVYKRTTDAEAPEPEEPVFELVMKLDAATTVKK